MDPPPTHPFTIAIEGNIAAGKSTLLNQIQNRDRVCILDEPVHKWTNLNGHNLLENFYKDPEKWAFPFDVYVMMTAWDQNLQGLGKPLRIIERSIYSCRYCFVKNLLDVGVLERGMFEVLEALYKRIHRGNQAQVDLIIYLRTEPDVAYQRMLSRNRKEEMRIPLDYLQQLHELHEQWLIREAFPLPCPLLILDGNAPDMAEEYSKVDEYLLAKGVWKERLF